MMDADVKARLLQEHRELEQRIVKLIAFLRTSQCEALPFYEQLDLREQLLYMQGYYGVLGRRVGRLE